MQLDGITVTLVMAVGCQELMLEHRWLTSNFKNLLLLLWLVWILLVTAVVMDIIIKRKYN